MLTEFRTTLGCIGMYFVRILHINGLHLRGIRAVWVACCFVLETIRTGAMRVIHITVKTEETQRLRIKFVLVLSYLNSTQHLSTVCTVLSYLCLQTQASLPFQLSIRSKILATNSANRSMILTTNKSTILHCEEVYSSSSRSTFPPGMRACHAVGDSSKNGEVNRRHISPCMDSAGP